MPRIRFANQLRGIAALCVACSHLIGVYWAMPEVVSAVTATPPQAGPLPPVFWLVAHQWFNFGPFGVAVFFLISGLVVPFSLEQHTRASFVLARLLRIYPTYAAALLFEVAAIALSAWVWGRPLPFTAATVLGNLTLTYDLIGQPSLDLVNWTLSVELKFYLVIALLAGPIRRGSLVAVAAIATAILGANLLMAAGWLGNIDAAPSTPSYTFSSHSVCLVYMLIGTLFNFHLRGRLGATGLVGGVLLLSAAFVAAWQAGVWRAQYPVVTANYLYGLLVFAALYGMRAHIGRVRLLDGMAAISFPFYVLHSLIGYTALRAAMVGLHLGYAASLLLALGCVVLAAYALHVAVETPTQRLGRRWRAKAGTGASPAIEAAAAPL